MSSNNNPSSTTPSTDPIELSSTEKHTLQSMTHALALSANEYIQNHPELQSIIKDFVTSVLNEKPTNLLSYAQQYFTLQSGEVNDPNENETNETTTHQ